MVQLHTAIDSTRVRTGPRQAGSRSITAARVNARPLRERAETLFWTFPNFLRPKTRATRLQQTLHIRYRKASVMHIDIHFIRLPLHKQLWCIAVTLPQTSHTSQMRGKKITDPRAPAMKLFIMDKHSCSLLKSRDSAFSWVMFGVSNLPGLFRIHLI